MMDLIIPHHNDRSMLNKPNQYSIGNPPVRETFYGHGAVFNHAPSFVSSASSSCFDDDFPLPFQEVSKDEYYVQRKRSLACISPAQTSNTSVREQRIHLFTNNQTFQDDVSHPLHKKQRVSLIGSTTNTPPTPQLQVSSSSSSSSIPRQVSSSSSVLQVVPGAQTTTAAGLKARLPANFSPHPWSVIIGRDKVAIEAMGNKRLRVLIGCYLESYAESRKDKDKKSLIISEIESTIRKACVDNNADTRDTPFSSRGAFIKYQDGQWWEVEASLIREKIGRILRELLHTKYSSSSRQKRARRQRRLDDTKKKLLADKKEVTPPMPLEAKSEPQI